MKFFYISHTKLTDKSIQISGSDIEKVATVSSGGDKEIGSIIKKAMDNVYPYTNLEFDLEVGKRGERNDHVIDLINVPSFL